MSATDEPITLEGPALADPPKLLQINSLTVVFDTETGPVEVLKDITLTVATGEVLCLVGESGCGKTLTALTTMGLLPHGARIVGGSVSFAEHRIDNRPENVMGAIRGREITMIFQEPVAALNPVHSVGSQIGEALGIRRGLSRRESLAETVALLRRVGVTSPEERLSSFPHELSGGIAQRVMIAMAIATEPRLIIADEPTTALDVTIQAQILELLRKLKCELGTALLLINHDLGVVAEIADRVAVMYAGRIVEEAPVRTLFALPRHPYTRALLRSRPRIDTPSQDFTPIPGTAPSLMTSTQGCAFAPRCTSVRPYCSDTVPVLEVLGPSRVACHRVGELN